MNSDTADNIDLHMIVQEFESFYEIKFGRPPKLIKKIEDKKGGQLPKIPNSTGKKIYRQNSKQGTNRKSASQSGPSKNEKDNGNSKLNKQPSTKGGKDGKDTKDDGKSDMNSSFDGIQGNAFVEEEKNDFFDVRVLKGLPNYEDVPEYRDLAAYLQRDILIENPNIRFSDIVGLDNAKRLLKEAVLLPLKYPHFFTGILEPWRGILLFGPPGTGKTMLAKAVATECKTTFFNISASSVVSKWRGESEKLIRVLFDLARHYQPSTIFLDELDSIMSQRKGGDSEHEGSRRMKTELLIQMDGLMKNREHVFLLAASNLPWDLDMAMLRRLEKRILVSLPSVEAKEDMLKKFLPSDRIEGIDHLEYAKKLENYSGSDIKLLCKEACMKPLRRLINELEDLKVDPKESRKKPQGQPINPKDVMPGPVTNQDFQEALNVTKNASLIKTDQYEKWESNFGSN